MWGRSGLGTVWGLGSGAWRGSTSKLGFHRLGDIWVACEEWFCVERPVLQQDALTTVEDATTDVKLSETGIAFHMVLPVSAAQSGVVAYLKEQWSELKSPRYVGPDLRHFERHKHATTWGRHSQKSLTAPKWAHTRDSRCAAASTRMCPLFVKHFKSASDAGTLLEFPKMETELCISSETNGSVG